MTNARERVPLLLAWLLPFVLFLATAYRDVNYWDNGEMETVPYILGILHPTGFPAYTLFGWLWTHVVPFGNVAFRMTLISVISLSLCAYLVARIIAERYGNKWAGTVAAWIFAAGGTVWVHATKAEVHAFAALAIAATLYCALRWYRDGEERWFLYGAIAWAIGIAVHPVCALLLPGLMVMLIARLRTVKLRTVVVGIALASAIVIAFYAYLPLRSAYIDAHNLDPQVQQLGLPAGRPFFNYDNPSTPEGFIAEVTGADFQVGEGLRGIVDPVVYRDKGLIYIAAIRAEFTWFGIALVIAGIIVAFRRERASTIGLILCGALAIPFALGYPDETDVARYFLTSFFVGSIFIGAAIAEGARALPRVRWAAPAAAGLIAVFLLATQPDRFHQPWDNQARKMINLVRVAAEPNAVVVAQWAYAPPLAYAKYVEHNFSPDLDVAWLSDDAEYVRQWAKTRPIYYVGPFPGEIPGFKLVQLLGKPPIYRLVKQ